jgi:hypothetical protein
LALPIHLSVPTLFALVDDIATESIEPPRHDR